MNERTAVLFLILCVAALLGLIELEKIWEQEVENRRQEKIEQAERECLVFQY